MKAALLLTVALLLAGCSTVTADTYCEGFEHRFVYTNGAVALGETCARWALRPSRLQIVRFWKSSQHVLDPNPPGAKK